MKKQILNLPNKLTVLRMILTPIFVFLFLWEKLPYHYIWGTLVFILGSLTDFADGKIARKYQMITTFGKLTDPIADKMLTTAALLIFLDLGLCSVWIPLIVLTREFAVASIRMLASAQGVVIPANIWGKLKTVSQMLFTVAIMLLLILTDSGVLPPTFPVTAVSGVLLWITAVLTVISGVIYLKNAVKIIDLTK